MRISDWSSDVCSSDLTNYESRKGRQLLASGKAALLFHWKSLRRQVRVEGAVAPVGAEEADAYFDSRPRQSQIGAWASQQSRPLESRFELEKRVALFAAKHALGKVPRPPYWSGFRDRKSGVSGQSVSARVDLGGSRIIKKKKN